MIILSEVWSNIMEDRLQNLKKECDYDLGSCDTTPTVVLQKRIIDGRRHQLLYKKNAIPVKSSFENTVYQLTRPILFGMELNVISQTF